MTLAVSDFDQFDDVLFDYEAEYIRSGTGKVDVELARIELERVILLRGAGEIPHHTVQIGLASRALFFVDAPSSESIWHGEPADERTVLAYGPGGELVGHTRGHFRWAALLCEPATLERHALALGIDPARALQGPFLATPAAHELRAAVRQAFAASDMGWTTFSDPALRRAVEEPILTAAAHAVHAADEIHSASAVSHERVVRRAHEVLAARPRDPIYLSELCEATGVSERTLRNAFQHVYGLSPIRFLNLRRMDQVRAALREADPGTRRVSEIAQDFGFTNPGRFATEFRELFGERPSQTLRATALRPRGRPSPALPVRFSLATTRGR